VNNYLVQDYRIKPNIRKPYRIVSVRHLKPYAEGFHSDTESELDDNTTNTELHDSSSNFLFSNCSRVSFTPTFSFDGRSSITSRNTPSESHNCNASSESLESFVTVDQLASSSGSSLNQSNMGLVQSVGSPHPTQDVNSERPSSADVCIYSVG